MNLQKLVTLLCTNGSPFSDNVFWWISQYQLSMLCVSKFTGSTVLDLLPWGWLLAVSITVKPVLKDHCHDRPPVLRDQIILPSQSNWTCHHRPPGLRDHIFMASGVVFQDRLYCATVACNCASTFYISSWQLYFCLIVHVYHDMMLILTMFVTIYLARLR